MKKNLLIRLTSLVVLLTVFIGTFAACSKPNDSEITTSATVTTELIPETEDPLSSDELGDLTFEGESFDILTRKSTSYEIISEDANGDLVSTAVHNRNVNVEERFKVKINAKEIAGDWAQRDSFMSAVENAILGGTHDYDFVMTHSSYIVNMAAKGQGYDLTDLPNMKLGKRWWCAPFTQNSAINGRSYIAMGDLGHTLYEYLMCIFFNQRIVNQVGLPDLYQMVKDGKWTYDKLREFSLMYNDDLNGDGVFDKKDCYGLALNDLSCRMTAIFWNLELTVPNENGKHVLNLPNDKFLKTYEELYDLIWNNTNYVTFDSEGKNQVSMFTNGQLMFFSERLYDAGEMKEMSDEYGIIPFPKYDEMQADYCSSPRNAVSAYMVMSDIQNPEMIGAVMEALCMEGYRKIVPAYYEITLKYKYLQDPRGLEMLDIIRTSTTFTFSAIYSNLVDTFGAVIGENIKSKNPSVMTLIKGKSKIWSNLLDNLYNNFEKIK